MTGRIVVLELARLEAAHLAGLVSQFDDLLRDTDAQRGDPAIERLAPRAYDDDAAAREFRELTESELLDRRRSDAGIVLASLGEAADMPEDPEDPRLLETISIRLDDADARAWLRTLAAIRLVLATRLGIAQPEDHDPDDPRFGIYDCLGYRLDGLVSAVDEEA